MISGLPYDFGVGFVKERHHFHPAVTYGEHQRQKLIDADVGPGGLGHGVLYHGVYFRVLVVEIGGMSGIGCHPLATVHGKLLEPAYVGIFFRKYAGNLFIFFGLIGCREEFNLRQGWKSHPVLAGGVEQLFLDFECAPDVIVERIVVEVCVGYGGEQRIDHRMARFDRGEALSAQGAVDGRDTGHSVEQKIHTGRSFGMFAAYAPYLASFATCSFLALIAEHIRSVFHKRVRL